MRNFFVILFLLVICGISYADTNTAGDTEFSSQLSIVSSKLLKSELKQVGAARFKVFIWDIYDSRLYSENGQYHEDDNFLFEITYLKDISKKALIDRTIEQWQHLKIPAKNYGKFTHQLDEIWPDIKKGDQLSLWVTNSGSTFYFNDELIGTISDVNFGDLFAAIWLSPDTSQPKLRKQLLGM